MVENKKAYKNIFIIFIISRIVLFLLATAITEGGYKDAFYNFDIEHYLTIARTGYYEAITAFFPVVPLLMKFFDIFGIPVLGVMVVNNIATLFSAILLYKLTDDFTSAKLFLCSPIAVFTFIAYTESLFIFITLLVLYLYKNEKYIAAGIFLGLGVCCRNMTAMLFFSIFIIMAIKFFQKKLTLAPIFKMYIPATLISLIYPVYLQLNFGNWKSFMDVQFTYWGRQSSNLITAVIADVQYLFTEASIIQKTQVIYQFILLALMITLIVFSIKKIWKTKNEMDAICVLYLILSIFAIYASVRRPELSIPSASFYRYFYACISVYMLPCMFKNKFIEDYRNIRSFGLNIGFAAMFAVFYYCNLFMC